MEASKTINPNSFKATIINNQSSIIIHVTFLEPFSPSSRIISYHMYRSTIQNFPQISIPLVCLSCLFQKMPDGKPQGKMREGPEGKRMAVLSRTSKLHQCLHMLSTFFLHSINSSGLCQTKQCIIGNTPFPLPDHHDCSADGEP
ncbi:uncharacterized protein EAF02_011727 [Botrytis sinoallii]|uniref:uncharacterized protein n=1 Tax=Botrytis sinoallii TaxID=1463999 RepID=UPI001901D150|nr:uncharacterized protein EAF02_011727 [Botrytis sinoallii]KAF7854109.1 hypothetical protein EAF02_011727 [Botrytis sinoallii]